MDWFTAETMRAADVAWGELMRNPGIAPLYLWHRRGGLTYAAEKPGPEWDLTHPEPERGFRTRDQMRRRTWELARRAPCLPLEGAA